MSQASQAQHESVPELRRAVPVRVLFLNLQSRMQLNLGLLLRLGRELGRELGLGPGPRSGLGQALETMGRKRAAVEERTRVSLTRPKRRAAKREGRHCFPGGGLRMR